MSRIIGTSLVFRTARHTDRPSRLGIIISSRTASKSRSSSRPRAWTPSAASAGISPLLRRKSHSTSRSLASSSTIRIFQSMVFSPFPAILPPPCGFSVSAAVFYDTTKSAAVPPAGPVGPAVRFGRLIAAPTKGLMAGVRELRAWWSRRCGLAGCGHPALRARSKTRRRGGFAGGHRKSAPRLGRGRGLRVRWGLRRLPEPVLL